MMQEIICTIHDFKFAYDANCPALKKVENFYAACPICTMKKLNETYDKLTIAEARVETLVAAIDIAKTIQKL